MRLVIDGRRLTAARTGVGRYLEGLLQEWARTGPPLPETIVALSSRGGLARVPAGGGGVAKLIGEGWPGLAWEQWGLGRLLRKGDVLFAPANLVPSNWRGKTALVLFDLTQEVFPDSFPWHVRRRFGRRYQRAAARADRILVPSRSTADDLKKVYGIPPAHIRVVYPGIGPEFRPDAGAAVTARQMLGIGSLPFFLFVGKRSRRRNVSAILDAFATHRRTFPESRLVFAGPDSGGGIGPDNAELGLIGAGHVSEPILRGLLTDATGLLYPSNYEGFGLPVIEAMACGCPVVTLRNSTLVESGGDAAWYVELPEPTRLDAGIRPLGVVTERRHEALTRGLAAAMHALSTDAALRSELVGRGLMQAARFPLSACAEAVKEELIDLASLMPTN